MAMPGGGHHKVAAGQITDDSEMAMCILHALTSHKEMTALMNRNKLCLYYGMWKESKPFDIGNTTRASIFKCDTKSPNFELPYKACIKSNGDSQSNSCIMRITPMVVFASRLEIMNFKECITADTQFTHCNKVAIDCTLAYSYLIKCLIKSTGTFKERAESALEETVTFISSELQTKDVKDWYETALKLGNATKDDDYNLDSIRKKVGWCKHGFILSVHFLQTFSSKIEQESPEEISSLYEAVISDCLALGGDSDTNGAIVGGVIGAWLGESNLPQTMKDKIFKCKVATKGATSRPQFLQTKHCLDGLLKSLITLKNSLPETIEIK